MWSDKKIGVRQHHCRKCGKALCDKCSNNRTILPKLGFELVQIRTCLECFQSVSENDKKSMITTFDLNRQVNQSITGLQIDKDYFQFCRWGRGGDFNFMEGVKFGKAVNVPKILY